MFGNHFYHATIRRFVSVFGTLFNNISVVRKDSQGNVKSIVRVPLAYGPKEKFLVRIDEQPDLSTPNVAIKLPRMSFEILNIAYDTQSKLNRNNKILIDNKIYYTYSPYNISINLSIMAKNQDDALQIIEQIIPYFQPEYTITVKESISSSLKTDIPITLSTIDMQEDYEGDFMNRRAIIYTLSFDAKVRFYGPDRASSQIKKVIVNTLNQGVAGSGFEQQLTKVDPSDADINDGYTIIEEINYLDDPGRANLVLQGADYGGNGGTYILLEQLVGQTSGATGVIQDISGSEIVLSIIGDTPFLVNELVVGGTSGAQYVVKDFSYAKGYI
jgi:hypothetical protein